MNLRKNIMMIVSVMVAVIIALSVLVPVIQDSSASEDTFTNDGLWRMKAIENGDTWVKSGTTITYNSADVLNYGDNGLWNIALGDDWCVRANGNARGSFVRSTSTAATVLAADDVITISGSGIVSNNTPPITGYGYSAAGDYVLTDPTIAPYVNKDSQLYATGVTLVEGSTDIICHITGSIEDGLTITSIDPYGSTPYTSVEFSNVNIDYDAVDGHEDLFKINKITFTATTVDSDSQSNEVEITYTSYIAPYEVSAERSAHVSTIEASLLGIIPLLVVIGIVIGAVWFIRQKN